MSNFVVALLAGLGLGGWVYSKAMRQTGGNTQTALISAGGAGFVGFLVMMLIMSFIPGV